MAEARIAPGVLDLSDYVTTGILEAAIAAVNPDVSALLPRDGSRPMTGGLAFSGGPTLSSGYGGALGVDHGIEAQGQIAAKYSPVMANSGGADLVAVGYTGPGTQGAGVTFGSDQGIALTRQAAGQTRLNSHLYLDNSLYLSFGQIFFGASADAGLKRASANLLDTGQLRINSSQSGNSDLRVGGNGISSQGQNLFAPYSASLVPLILQGAASQSANLTEWQNSAGTPLAYIRPNGSFAGSGVSAFEQARVGVLDASATSRFSVSTDNAGLIGQVVRGAASQSVNLQEWQNSAGTPLAYITAGGNLDKIGRIQSSSEVYARAGSDQIMVGTNGLFNGFHGYVANVQNTSMGVHSAGSWLVHNPQATGNARLLIKAGGTQSQNLQEWQDSTGNVLAAIKADGTIRAGNNFNTINTVSGTNDMGIASGASIKAFINANAKFSVQNQTAGITALDMLIGSAAHTLVAKGYPSQTANLQEWQNSTGVVLANVKANGNAFFAGRINFDSDAGDYHHIGVRPAGSPGSQYLELTSANGIYLNSGNILMGPITADSASVTPTIDTNYSFGASAFRGGRFRAKQLGTVVGQLVFAGTSDDYAAGTYLDLLGDLSVRAGVGGTKVMGLTAAGDFSLPVAGKGVTLKSPDGLTTRTLSIDNTGTLVIN